MELELYYEIKKSYEISTINTNHFENKLKTIEWDAKFYEDNEYYFVKGRLIFTTPSLNPFSMKWRPTMIFSDNTTKEM